jgi:AcrR family transcriptional regulator
VPRPRFARLEISRQRAILETAAAAFAAGGYQKASLNQIIEAAGLSKGLFYYYFDGKADLFAAVVDLLWDTLFPDGAFDIASLDGGTFWPRLEALARDNQRRIRAQPWLVGVTRLLHEPPADADVERLLRTKLCEAHQFVGALLRRGQEVGMVRTDMPMEMLLSVLTAADHAGDRWMLAHWNDLDDAQRGAVAESILDLWRRIASPAPRKEPSR